MENLGGIRCHVSRDGAAGYEDRSVCEGHTDVIRARREHWRGIRQLPAFLEILCGR
jgi:hypothetical protein